MDIQCSENILLLGAGFTKNFGGLLADEMWAEIFNHEKIQAQPRVTKMMMNDFNYESVYYYVLEDFNDKEGLFGQNGKWIIFTDEEKDAIKVATKSAYDHIDDILRWHTIDISNKKWFGNVNRLLINFGKTNNSSFIFTLNQDLFIERFYRNTKEDHPGRFPEARLSLPGIDKYPEWFINVFYPKFDLHLSCEQIRSFYVDRIKSSDYCTLPTEDELNQEKDRLLVGGSYFLIKLHGSYNWINSNNSDMMVIGRGKSDQIQSEPLLKCYFEIFNDVLSKSHRRLLIIGYGFGDEHINRVVSNSVKNHGLKIYILSPESPKEFKKKMWNELSSSEYTVNIWKGISGYFQCVDDVLVSSIYENEIVREQFYDIFFGEQAV
jgi:hypothetical protein